LHTNFGKWATNWTHAVWNNIHETT
jgi:hypothetical protein